MGYDMYVQHESGKMLADLAYPRSEAPPMKEDRDQWMEWFDKRSAPEFYLRRNISGQPRLREMLLEVNAVFDGYDFESGWAAIAGVEAHVMGNTGPEWPGDEHFDYGDDFERIPVTEEGKAYEEANEAYLRWRPEHPGIPIHKLCDNSGWHVTSDECEEALEAIKDYAEEHGSLPIHPDYEGVDWDPWEGVVPFLESAAKHDGFRVY